MVGVQKRALPTLACLLLVLVGKLKPPHGGYRENTI